MIEYIKDNYVWLSAVVIPVVVAIIGGIAVVINKSGRKQNVGDVKGNNNSIINGDVKN